MSSTRFLPIALVLGTAAHASPRIPGTESSAPREAISAEESLDDFDPLEGMVVNGRLQAHCVFENVRPGISFVVYEGEAWLRPTTADDRKIVSIDPQGNLWRVGLPRDLAIGGLDEQGPYLRLDDTRTHLAWNDQGHLVLPLFETEATGKVQVVLAGSSACSRADTILAAGAWWYWVAHPASLGSKD